MPLVVAAEVYRLVMTCRLSATITVQNTFSFGREAPGGSPTSLATDWRDNIVPALKPQFYSNISYVEVMTQRIAPTESEQVRVALSGTATNGSGPPLPSVACGITTWRTQLPGKSRRGRSYWSGLPYDTSSLSNGYNWNGPGISRLDTIANAILTRYTLGGNPGAFFLCVWSRKLGGATPPRDPAAGAAMVVSFTSQPYIGSMGTRRYGHGI